MAYTINKSNGESIIVSDGTVDTSSTSLVLIGKNYAGYGAFLNDNFVRILENFSNNTSPANPLKGQLWWDTNNNILKVYSGTSWKISTGATSSPFSSPPGDLSALGGDLWFDTTNSQLKVYSGSSWITVGPQSLVGVADTGAFPATMTDTSAGTHIVVQFKINGTIYAILAYETFSTAIGGFGTIKPGLNFKTNAPAALQLSTQDVTATAGTLVQRNSTGGLVAADITGTSVSAGVVTATNFNGSNFNGNLIGNVSATTVSTTSLVAGTVTGTNGISGTILTASQPNITNLGNVYNLSTNGVTNITGYATYNGAEIATTSGGTLTVTGGGIQNTAIGMITPNVAKFTTVTITTSLVPAANLVIDLGSPTLRWNNVYAQTLQGKAVQAQYADLAERFHADAEYVPGTVVELGGTAEITKVIAELSDKVFGVISTNAAYLMNSGAGTNLTHPPVAMSGRVPVRTIGSITKGDRLVSAGNGLARAGKKEELTPWNVIGRSLVDKNDQAEGLIEAIVKINS
jgi:hypothetical protein